MTYTIQTDVYRNLWIKCLLCGLGSYNPRDIGQAYCGYCRKLHAVPKEQPA
jgi:ribosomal protein L37E